MKAEIVLAAALVAMAVPTAHGAVAGGAAAAFATMSAATASDAARRAAAAARHPSDCAACHRELFPFELPRRCAISSDPMECWSERYLNGRTRIMTREAGDVRRVYRLKTDYGPDRVFMPAENGAENPHYVLEAR